MRRELADLEPGSVVVVACSGGADSVALLAATVFTARDAGWRVVGVTVDHGLQEGSAARADTVVAQMAELGADETVTVTAQVDVAGGLGVEAAAREARYAVLGELAARLGAATVLLGHTRDDQAETVLLGLARGSGPRSLAGMRRRFECFRRPLLDLSRVDTDAACRAEDLRTWSDPHNEDPAFTRSRVRHRVLPVLEEELGPGVPAALARTADLLREDVDHLDGLAEQTAARLGSTPLVDDLAALPAAVRRRVLRLLVLAAGVPAADLTHGHLRAVDGLVMDWRGQRWIDLPGPARAQRRDGRLVVTPG
ncbi:MAG: tRNA lysidine(34) synthetase TilS [Nocardioides sp.]